MPISGFLMYGSAQKNMMLRVVSFVLLAVYLLSTLTAKTFVDSLPFFCINLYMIYFVTLLIKRAGNQLVSSMSILIYSVIIDIICFFAYPMAGVSLPLYIWSGLVFNFKSALPVFVFACTANLAEFIYKKYFLTRNCLVGNILAA